MAKVHSTTVSHKLSEHLTVYLNSNIQRNGFPSTTYFSERKVTILNCNAVGFRIIKLLIGRGFQLHKTAINLSGWISNNCIVLLLGSNDAKWY